ncbi:efflux RND transporter permease subunit [Paenibacillus senegalensis]|uniref:efflux RND transporter permease subunit n=1 Tax=Paenibacillus senegalensis TaxID=1465766 RepID=UPI000288FBAE|nr:efflux RND transporter permease subunit [Paenibacillus senegalensis]
MKGIINFSLKNKFAIWLLTIIVTVTGIYSGFKMNQEMLPDIEIPAITITTVYPGATPEDVANKVSIPLEQRITNLNGVNAVNSTSMDNVSMIQVEYEFRKSMDTALDEIREAIAGWTVPDGVQQPQISRININAFPVVSLGLSAEGRTLEELTELVEQQVRPVLEGIDGVADVSIAGQYVDKVELVFDSGQLAAYGLDEETVKGVIQGSVLQIPLGMFELDESEKAVVVDGNITTIDALRTLAIPVLPSAGIGQPPSGMMPGSGNAPGSMPAEGQAPGMELNPGQAAGAETPEMPGELPETDGALSDPEPIPSGNFPVIPGQEGLAGIPTVQLQELAEIRIVGEADSISRLNGEEAIGIQVIKAPDANTVHVVNAVKDAAQLFAESHEGVSLTPMLDQAKPIEDSIHTMLSKALFGGIFAIIIILLFLRNFRTTLISVISIPLSLLLAIIALKQMDITLNIMTLGAMTVAIGRVVDDSIVVIENIYRRMSLQSEKLRGKELIREATREMFIPILSSTIVTIAVFVPLAAVTGPVGEIFVPFALTMVFALLASLLVAITIVPMMAHSMFKRGVNKKHNHDEKPGKLAGSYRRLLNWTLNHKLITFGSAVLILSGSLFLMNVVGFSFLPEEEEKYVMVTYSPAPGELLSDVEQSALQAEKYIMENDQVTNMQFSIGAAGPMGMGTSRSGLFYIQFADDTLEFDQVKTSLMEGLQQLDTAGEWNIMDMASGLGDNKLTLQVYGESLEVIQPVAEQLMEIMEAEGDLDQASTSMSETLQQYTLVVDQEKASGLGLTAAQIALELMPQREQQAVTTIKENGRELDVVVAGDNKVFSSLEQILETAVVSPIAGEIPLSELVVFQEEDAPNSVTRRNGQLFVEVSADILASDVGGVSAKIQSQIDAMSLPEDVSIAFGGVVEQLEETFNQLSLAMLAAIAIVYFILVVTFGGGLAPFAILFSLPFTAIGALLGLWIAGETLSVPAMMGLLMLIGIVVTNAIVLLDRVIHNEQAGLTTREALLEAGATRLRPILMTALATIGALLPLAFGFESGGMISKGLGVTVIGGLTSSTLLTLVIVPIVYEFLMKFRRNPQVES